MHQPRVLFLDEPTAGLDPESRRSLWAYLGQVRRQYGTTVFLTTHYLEEAETADTVCVLAGGRIIERGSPAEVKGRHMTPELVLDASDLPRLRGELTALGLQATGTAPLRVRLGERSAQSIIRAIESELTQFRIEEPTLEDAYLLLLERARDASLDEPQSRPGQRLPGGRPPKNPHGGPRIPTARTPMAQGSRDDE
jgi:ABC-2 type transport system ATP-binding protein